MIFVDKLEFNFDEKFHIKKQEKINIDWDDFNAKRKSLGYKREVIIDEACKKFGSQSISVSIDVRKINQK